MHLLLSIKHLRLLEFLLWQQNLPFLSKPSFLQYHPLFRRFFLSPVLRMLSKLLCPPSWLRPISFWLLRHRLSLQHHPPQLCPNFPWRYQKPPLQHPFFVMPHQRLFNSVERLTLQRLFLLLLCYRQHQLLSQQQWLYLRLPQPSRHLSLLCLLMLVLHQFVP